MAFDAHTLPWELEKFRPAELDALVTEKNERDARGGDW